MKNYKWWQDNERYIPDPRDEIAKFEQELKQMAITESALRARLRAALVEAINKRAETTEWRTDHPTTTGNPERWVRDELCIKWRAAIDAARKEEQP
jgi:hypothetical protein